MISDRELETSPARSIAGLRTLPRAELRGHGYCRMAREAIAEARRQPGSAPPAVAPIPASVLRHSDDQTVVAVAAVLAAIRRMEASGPSTFEDWGILAASRFLGRSTLAAALDRFDAEGVWGVSPHLIPHYALHSPAGTLSLALHIRGPSLGIGGGVGAGFEGYVAALSWLASGAAPGLWFIQTGWSPELAPDSRGEPQTESECEALALALVPAESASSPGAMPELRMTASRDSRARQSLTIGEVGTLLELGATERPDRYPPIFSRGRAYLRDGGSDGVQPHLGRKARRGPDVQTVACDASGRTRLELVLPASVPVREDD